MSLQHPCSDDFAALAAQGSASAVSGIIISTQGGLAALDNPVLPALFRTCGNLHVATARVLLGHGADVNQGTQLTYEVTPLLATLESLYETYRRRSDFTAQSNRIEDGTALVQLLLKHGAIIPKGTLGRRTALEYAALICDEFGDPRPYQALLLGDRSRSYAKLDYASEQILYTRFNATAFTHNTPLILDTLGLITAAYEQQGTAPNAQQIIDKGSYQLARLCAAGLIPPSGTLNRKTAQDFANTIAGTYGNSTPRNLVFYMETFNRTRAAANQRASNRPQHCGNTAPL